MGGSSRVFFACELLSQRVMPRESKPASDYSASPLTRIDDRRALRRLRDALDILPDALFLVDRVSLALVDVNQAACVGLGYSRTQLLSMRLPQVVAESCHPGLVEQLETITAAAEGAIVVPTMHRSSAGLEFPVDWSVRAMPKRNDGLLMIIARNRREAGISPKLLLDPLTGLALRTSFDERLAAALQRAQQQCNYRFAVLFVDLDGFKLVNDRFGHLRGDRLLQDVARRLAACIRPGDMVARRGGDEFTVFVDDIRDQRDAVGVAERIQKQLQEPLESHSQSLTITASIGVVISSPRYREAEALIHDADRAMYEAKATGRAVCAVFNENSDRAPRWPSLQ